MIHDLLIVCPIRDEQFFVRKKEKLSLDKNNFKVMYL